MYITLQQKRLRHVILINGYCMYIADSRGCIHAAQAPIIVNQVVFCVVGFSAIAIEYTITAYY